MSTLSRYLIIVEPTATVFSAYSPDVPGCVATARSRADLACEMREAIAFRLDGLREDGRPVPRPRAAAAYVGVAAWTGRADA